MIKTIIFKNIPKDIHRKFKMICAEKGITMREAFIQFMIKFSK